MNEQSNTSADEPMDRQPQNPGPRRGGVSVSVGGKGAAVKRGQQPKKSAAKTDATRNSQPPAGFTQADVDRMLQQRLAQIFPAGIPANMTQPQQPTSVFHGGNYAWPAQYEEVHKEHRPPAPQQAAQPAKTEPGSLTATLNASLRHIDEQAGILHNIKTMLNSKVGNYQYGKEGEHLEEIKTSNFAEKAALVDSKLKEHNIVLSHIFNHLASLFDEQG